MADLASTDITVTIEAQKRSPKTRVNRVKIVFGDGALTYPALGVPMPAFASFGFKRNIDYLVFFDTNDAVGLVWKWDKDNNKLRAWQSGGQAAHTHDLHLNQADVVDGAGTRVNAATNLIGANSGADVLIAGVADTTGHGGVVQLAATAAAALLELGNVAVAAQTLYAEARGW